MADLTSITIRFDVDNLRGYTDEFLAQLWHVGQANPAPIKDVEAGRIAERLGREIIHRWLSLQSPALWNHQGAHEAYALREAAHAQATGGAQ